MPNILNGGFEIAGVNPGDAADWNFLPVDAAEEFADFNVDQDVDSFEADWANDSYLFVFGLLDIVAPLFDTGVGSGETFEDFSEGWSSNEAYLFDLASATAALFDGEAYEDFEESWSSNESYSFTMGSVIAAEFPYDFVNEGVEKFEEGWSDNFNYSFVMGSTVTAEFQEAFNPYEDFELVAPLIPVAANPTTDVFTATAHGLANGSRVTFVSDGQLPENVIGTTTYFVVNTAANTFQVSLTSGGAVHGFTTGENGNTWVRRDPAIYWLTFLS